MLVFHSRYANRGESQVGEALADLPGVAISNVYAAGNNRTREIDWVVVTPSALASIEVKGTRLTGAVVTDLNSAWTINGAPVDFAGGPNPVGQTRRAAATVRGHLDEAGIAAGYYVNAITVINGEVNLSPHQVGDTWVCLAHQLAGVLLRIGRKPIDAATAAAIASAFGQPDIPAAALESQAFPVAAPQDPPTTTDTTSSAQRRHDSRRHAMAEIADALWERSHLRRVVLSGIGGALSLLYLVTRPWQSVVVGFALMAVIAGIQLVIRIRLTGPRQHGFFAVLVWLTTLTPYVGVFAALSSPFFTRDLHGEQFLLDDTVSVLVGLTLWLTTLAGRCAFVYPPQVVVERYDSKNRPTGAFLLANPAYRGDRGFDMRMLDSADPRSKTVR